MVFQVIPIFLFISGILSLISFDITPFLAAINALHPAWGCLSISRRGNLMYDYICSLSLCLVNNGSPIHAGRPESQDSAIDLSYCSPDLIWSLSWSVINDSHGSDHFPILISVTTENHFRNIHSLGFNHNSMSKPHCTFNFNKVDWSSYSLLIQNAISSIPSDFPMNNSYFTFTKIVDSAAKHSIPTKNFKYNNFLFSPPWWNSSCTNAIKDRSRLFKIFRRSGSINDFLNYQNCCAATTHILKNAKREAWKTFCSSLNSST